MKMYTKLIRTFLLSGEMPKSEKKDKVKFYITLGIIATVCIFIPCVLLMTCWEGATTDTNLIKVYGRLNQWEYNGILIPISCFFRIFNSNRC